MTAAQAAGKEVHVWTVNDPDRLAPLVMPGVAGVITDEPEAMRRQLAAVQVATPVQRLLLAFRNRVIE